LITLQDFFTAHPALLQQFPGGVVQFAQIAGNMPEEALQEIVMNAQIMGEAAAQGALPHGEMPGGLPGDNFVLLDFIGEVDDEGGDPRGIDGTPVTDDATSVLEEGDEDEDEGEDEDDDVEEVGISMSHLLWFRAEARQIAPLPIRVLRNLVGRFWGSPNSGEEGSSDERLDREAELDGVD
jgi:hypothetical protein